eukprot:CAMPEP_0170552224 /NCGR_PEP_ID=MMETSP0211-20121228/10140_1 /TAXON_ID=311385 /ORGANISM="Pseudokeronopsis sp., Strain OXSARD2" /LENGTH=107 /DNA_ID=CAMNT_0010859813 /DNA_START=1271 /DNA_END=1594 /DNA_ORIENTATION=-
MEGRTPLFALLHHPGKHLYIPCPILLFQVVAVGLPFNVDAALEHSGQTYLVLLKLSFGFGVLRVGRQLQFSPGERLRHIHNIEVKVGLSELFDIGEEGLLAIGGGIQ